MRTKNGQPWNSLEVVKILVAITTPLLLAALGFLIDARFREAEARTQAASRAAEIAERRRESVRAISDAMYGRAARAAMLASGLRRHGAEPTDASLEEVVARKRAYDESFVFWNTGIQSMMLAAREVLESPAYTRMENHIEQRLVRRLFVPLDVCLTRAYDEAIRQKFTEMTVFLSNCACRPSTLIDPVECGVGDLVYAARECAYEITESLYVGTFDRNETAELQDTTKNRFEERCPPQSDKDRDLAGVTP